MPKNKGNKKASQPAAAGARTAAEQESFVSRNIRLLTAVVVLIVVVAVAYAIGRGVASRRGRQAAEALFPCEQYFQQGNYERALEGDGQNCIGLTQVAKQYSMTGSGNVAKLYAGLCYAQLGQDEEAKAYLSKYHLRKDQMISPAALGALGNTYIRLGDTEKGAETLIKAAKRADNTVLSPLFLVEAGEAYESLGMKDKAIDTYQFVKERYKASPQGSEIDKYIERAKRRQ